MNQIQQFWHGSNTLFSGPVDSTREVDSTRRIDFTRAANFARTAVTCLSAGLGILSAISIYSSYSLKPDDHPSADTVSSISTSISITNLFIAAATLGGSYVSFRNRADLEESLHRIISGNPFQTTFSMRSYHYPEKGKIKPKKIKGTDGEYTALFRAYEEARKSIKNSQGPCAAIAAYVDPGRNPTLIKDFQVKPASPHTKKLSYPELEQAFNSMAGMYPKAKRFILHLRSEDSGWLSVEAPKKIFKQLIQGKLNPKKIPMELSNKMDERLEPLRQEMGAQPQPPRRVRRVPVAPPRRRRHYPTPQLRPKERPRRELH